MPKPLTPRITAELKQELKKMFNAGSFAGVTKTVLKYFPPGRKARTDAQLLVMIEIMRSPKRRGTYIPLCCLMTARDAVGRHSGVAFGIIPNGTVHMQIAGQQINSTT
jgi:hypothetical protein